MWLPAGSVVVCRWPGRPTPIPPPGCRRQPASSPVHCHRYRWPIQLSLPNANVANVANPREAWQWLTSSRLNRVHSRGPGVDSAKRFNMYSETANRNNCAHMHVCTSQSGQWHVHAHNNPTRPDDVQHFNGKKVILNWKACANLP